MNKVTQVLHKKRFSSYQEVPILINNMLKRYAKDNPQGKIRFDIRDNVMLVTLVRWTFVTSNMTSAMRHKARQIEYKAIDAIHAKDTPITVNIGIFKFFVYSSVDDNLYASTDNFQGQYVLRDMSTGKELFDGKTFNGPYEAIEYLNGPYL